MNDTFVKNCCGSGIYGSPGHSIDFSGNGGNNNGNNGGQTPVTIDDSNYFKITKLFQELDTELKKRQARQNLGILLENFATTEDLLEYLRISDIDLTQFLTQADLENYITREEFENSESHSNSRLKMEWSNDLGKMKATLEDGDVYVSSAWEKLTKPLPPTIANSYLNHTVNTGSVKIVVTNRQVGAAVYYSVDNGAYQPLNNNSFTLDSGFLNDNTNTARTFVVKVKCYYNGIQSDEATYQIVVSPKCNAGVITINKNGNDNDFSTNATVILTPSNTKWVNNQYSLDGGVTWFNFNKNPSDNTDIPFVVQNVSQSQNAGKYQIRSTYPGYESASVSSPAFILNAKKTYYGWSTKENITTLNEIVAFGTSVEASGLQPGSIAGTYPLGVPSAPSYLWVFQTDYLRPSQFFTSADDQIGWGMIQMESVGGYNCYRSEVLQKKEANNIYIK